MVKVYEDVDLSAYQRGVRRPSFDALMRDVAGGRINGVLVWKLDRLVRRPPDFERFWTRCDYAGVFLASATEPIDSTTEVGLAVIRTLVNFASFESTSISLRLRARFEERARSGVPNWRGRAFGFTDDACGIVEEEAELIREAARRILAGEPAQMIVADWRRRGIVTSRGRPWRFYELISLLSSHRLVGDNTYRGKVVASGCFPAILDRVTAARVGALLANRGRLRSRGSGPRLLAGLLVCARCDGRLVGSTAYSQQASGDKARTLSYACRCGWVSINAEFIESLIRCAVLYRIETRSKSLPRAEPPQDAPERLVAAYDEFSAALRQLTTDYYVERRLTRGEWETARSGLERRLHSARRQFDPQWRQPLPRRPPSAIRFRADWDTLDVAHQRDIIASELQFATIDKPKQKATLDVSRVRATWWEDDPEMSPTPWTVTGAIEVDAWDRERWMTTKQVMSALGLSHSSVTRRVGAGELPAVKLGGQFRYLRTDVEKAQKVVEGLAGAITAEEAAHRLDVTKYAVLDWIGSNSLPAVKWGRRYFLQPAEVQAFGDSIGLTRDDLVTLDQATQKLGVHKQTVYKMVCHGDVRAIRRGHWIRLFGEDVMAMAKTLKELRIDDGSVGTSTVMRAFGVCHTTVYRLIREGCLPATWVRGRWRIDPKDLPAVMADWPNRRIHPDDRPTGTLTTLEASRKLGVSQAHLLECVRKGRLSAIRRPTRVYLRPSDLDAWAQESGLGEELIEQREAAHLLGLPRRAVGAMIQSGELPTVRPGKRVRLCRKDVVKLAAALQRRRDRDTSIDTAEVARRLGVSPNTVRAWVGQGRLPATLVRGRLRFRKTDVRHVAAIVHRRQARGPQRQRDRKRSSTR